ncbi:MAG: dihydrodipicolinate synthase family protein [Candidatus Eisenbacteria bacterium]
MIWEGVFAAITTPFTADLAVDEQFLARHATWLLDAGCTGIVPLGSLGEGATLTREEKRRVTAVCREVTRGRAALVPGVAALSTEEAISLAREAESMGADGLMVLPPYVYRGDARETEVHFTRVIGATSLPAMLYNNPIAYGTDLAPEQIARLAAALPGLVSVKESSTDVRRITDLKARLGDRLALFVGVDDLIVEGIAAGAVGWIAGLVNALPIESTRLFALARSGRWNEAAELYRWFLPLLRLDTLPKFVQLIKLVQSEVGMGSPRVRPPRLELGAEELAATLVTIREALARRPR